MDAVLQRGRQPRQGGAVAQQGALVTDGLRGKPRLGQQVSAQQVRERAGIDLVILEPG
jgi:hypothetical protein